ncbi:MAG: hypothetical protein LBT93_07285 [Treponema sp.]|jgi:hypothetical protein|nr:hypothetical protein [Treponema sp.]
MAIQPIDLQTLFTQLDKVGKNQAVQKDGFAIQQALQGIQMQKKTEEQIQSVNEAQNTGEGAERIKDRERKKRDGQELAERGNPREEPGKDGEGEAPLEKPLLIIRDPALGKNIDVSG